MPLSSVRSAPEALAREVELKVEAGARILIADAETLDDLRALAHLSSVPGLLLAGSSGLAEALAADRTGGGPITGRKAIVRVPSGQALFIVGSLTQTSSAQCDRLASSGRAEGIVIDSERALSEPDRKLERLLDLVSGIPSNLAMLLRTDFVVPALSDAEIRERGTAISTFFGQAACAIAEARKICFVFASGGDTAARVAQALGAECIDFTAELMPGLPYGYFESTKLKRKLYFASKSGGFGSPEALIKVLAQVSLGAEVARVSVKDIEESGT